MCMGGAQPAPEPDPLPPSPRKDEASATSMTARANASRMQGPMDNVGMTPTGDPNFNQNTASQVTLLGATKRV